MKFQAAGIAVLGVVMTSVFTYVGAGESEAAALRGVPGPALLAVAALLGVLLMSRRVRRVKAVVPRAD